jgi:rhodanese-related sulfurtransferase
VTQGPHAAIRHVDDRAAEALIREGSVRVLDVRTPEEYDRLGHIPGATLIPVDLIASAPAVLADEQRPVLVYCEHGVRSQRAAAVLAQAGVAQVINLAGGMASWRGPREFGPGTMSGPTPWLIDNADLLPRGGRVLDVACGSGRHALLLASVGFDVHAVDRDERSIARLRRTAEALHLRLRADVVDLEATDADLGSDGYDLVLVVHYLHRPLFPALARALAPGGALFYETFTREQAARRGNPTNPDFLLDSGELLRLVAPLDVVRQFEGESHDRFVASVVARRPA